MVLTILSAICYILDGKPQSLSIGGSLFISTFTSADGYTQVSRTLTARIILIGDKVLEIDSSSPNTSSDKAKLLTYCYTCASNPKKIKTTYNSEEIKEQLEDVADLTTIRPKIEKRKSSEDKAANERKRVKVTPQDVKNFLFD